MPENDPPIMPNIKISGEMLRMFNGEGDFAGWIQKAKLVASLAGVKDLATYLPLYLEGNALSVYLQMFEKDRGDAGKIEKRLQKAFADSQVVSYSKFVAARWTGESVDVYANELEKLSRLAGLTGELVAHLVKMQFVIGFPDHVSVELQKSMEKESPDLSDLIETARILVTTKPQTVSAGAVKPWTNGRPGASAPSNGSDKFGFKGKCFRCEGPHMARDCPEKRVISCYTCGEPGHMSFDCPKRATQGHGSGNHPGGTV